MTKDITHELMLAASYSSNWSNMSVKKTLMQILEIVKHYRADWDEKAGETWGVVLDDNNAIAMVCSKVPLVIYRKDEIRDLDTFINQGIVLIPISNFEDKIVSLNNGMIALIFGIDNVDIDASEEPFSINDLYYSTV